MGSRPRHSHLNGSPLCPIMTERGYRPCAATSTRPRAAFSLPDEPPMHATWYARQMAKAAQDLQTALQYGQPAELAPLALALSDTLRHVGAVGRYLEVAALNAYPSVGLTVIRAGGMADYAGLAYAEVSLAVAVAGHTERHRGES